MNIKELLAKLSEVESIEVQEKHLKDGTVVYMFFSIRPFPTFQPAWYPIVIPPGHEVAPRKEVEAMLRHLWQFQLDILPEEEEFDSEIPM